MNCICTLYDHHFDSFMPQVLQTFDRFARIHRFQGRYFDGLLDPGRAASWNKLIALERCFQLGYEWVFWADADSLFVGPGLELDFSREFVTSFDSNGLCLSHMLVRNTPYNRQLIQALLFLGDVRDETQFGIGVKWEQNALKALERFFPLRLDRFATPFVGEPLFPDTLHPGVQFLHLAITPNPDRAKFIQDFFQSRPSQVGPVPCFF